MENKLVCPKCGKEFKSMRARCGHMAVCGVEKVECDICHKLINRLSYNRHLKTHEKDHACLQCGKIIHGNKKFCNSSCAAQYNNPKRIYTPKYRKKREKHYKKCLYCGKDFHNYYQSQKFCSEECARQYKMQQTFKKNEIKFFKGELSEQQTLKKQVIAHSEYQCSICGLSEWNNNPIVLILDHIDGNPYNNIPENLRLVCPNCNSQLPTFAGKNKGKGRIERRRRYAYEKGIIELTKDMNIPG